jgi:nucleoside-diphosphate-sugar epimerase
MSGPIVLTGASGFLGKRLAALLCEQGFAVRAVYRRPEPPPELASLAERGVALIRADLDDEEGMKAALTGAQAVIHAAALARDWGPASAFKSSNVDATLRLLKAARAAGAQEFVFVSSISVHGFGSHKASSEEGPYYPLSHLYPRSKLEAEQAVLAENGPGFSACSLRLGYIFGPGDTTSSYRMFDAARRGAFGWIGSGRNRTSMVYVDDAAQALASALGKPTVAGQAINVVGDETISWRDFARAVYDAIGASGRPIGVPKALAWIGAALLSAGARVSGSIEGPPMTFYRVRRSTVEYVFSNGKAKRLLGFAPRTGIREGLALAAAAYNESLKRASSP